MRTPLPTRLLAEIPVLWPADYCAARRMEERLQAEQQSAIIAVPPIPALGTEHRFSAYFQGQQLPGRCPWVHAWDELSQAWAELAEQGVSDA